MLRKSFERVFTPGSPEQPAIEGGYYCYAQPPPGHWEVRCSEVEYPANGSLPVPPGTVITVVRDAEGNIVRIYATICASVWVVDGPAGPTSCTTVEPREYRPAVRARLDFLPVAGWDGGANSVQERAGDCETVFTVGLIVGGYVGFTASLADVADTARYTHAIYFHQLSGRPVFRIVESGQTVSHDTEYSLGDEFTIRRVGGHVTYWKGDQKVHDSIESSAGTLNVGSTLYLSGDTIP